LGKGGLFLNNRAGFWIRFVATLIDGLIIGVIQFVLSFILGDIMDPETNMGASTVINLILTIIYFVWFQTYNNGQTFGKKITGIRVANLDGGKVSFGMMFIREIIGKTISALILLIGFLMAAGKSKRALHDRIAKTIVIRTE
jgi:uncharacterized RDD family membrane protein YckC